jgi:hypothetical protein
VSAVPSTEDRQRQPPGRQEGSREPEEAATLTDPVAARSERKKPIRPGYPMRINVVSHDIVAFAEGREMNMFGRRKKGPDKTFVHSEDCRILAADPDVEIPWNEVETGHWRAECVVHDRVPQRAFRG